MSQIPTGTKVNFLKAFYDNANNFKLVVINSRQMDGIDIGGTLSGEGMVRECVENIGNLKMNTLHSSWSTKAVMMDSHSIPRSLLCGGVTGERYFKSGKTIANQFFVYKDQLTPETVIPNSGFEIRYIHKVFNQDGSLIKQEGNVYVEQGMFSIFEMEKMPSSVTINKKSSNAGSGGTPVFRWKIEQPDKGSLVWRVTQF